MSDRSAWEGLGTWSAPGELAPYTVIPEIDEDQVKRLSHTQGYGDLDEFLVTRRDTTFPVNLKTRARLIVESATLIYNAQNKVSLKLGKQTTRVYGTSVEVTIHPTTPVTVYTLNVKGRFVDGEAFDENLAQRVVVLFNPWSQSDGVYMEDADWREEYVLNKQGLLFVGDTYGTAWNLGLDRPDSLRAVLYLLETISNLSFDQKRSPILVSREMSALVNIQDENGVVVGRWDGNYYDGRSPSFWRGSGPILQQFYRSGGEPVKYGQCWVFSGVLLSVLRLLGIPSRSVTNFASAHDTNRNRTIDEYYNEMGEKLSYLSSGSDSIWNFHVWNEAYMVRPDLPAGFGGWQAVDATPQEESPQGGGYRAGPSPVKAIRDGNSVPYDTNFIIAEVNADIKKYIIDEHGVPRLFRVDTTTVGQDISTKAVGSYSREDLTHQYKYPEGTDWERRALYEGYDKLMKEVHDMEFEVPQAKYAFGEDVVFTVKATNKAKQLRLRGRILCEAITYTGRVLKEVNTLKVDKKVNKGKTEVFQVTVGGDIFSEYPGTKVYLRFNVMIAVVGTSQVFAETIPVSPTPPELTISGPDTIGLGDEATITVTFKNPLPVEMSDVTLNVDADNLLEDDDLIQTIGSIGPNAELSYSFDIAGLKLGTHTLVVGLESDKVELVTGKKVVKVQEDPVPAAALAPTTVTLDTVEIEDVELNVTKNRSAHHTERYDYDGLIVRRGQPFNLTLVTKKPLPSGTKVTTRAVFQLITNRRAHSFEVETISSANKNIIELEVKVPGAVVVGQYELLLTVEKGGVVTVVHRNVKVVLLFNPWSVEDSCHYPEADHLEEYVLNNRGRIWVGSAWSNYGRPWQFAQFKRDSLEVALYAMEQLGVEKRGDAVQVVRHISAMVNTQDDNGILVGNWSGNYRGGTSPTAWVGSAEILTEYNQTKTPVRYAQCWVFSGVSTSLYRCLGLPARSITNFDSAHDTEFNRAIDRYFDEDGDSISHGDSIWNFHVWNEAYMARPDLPAGFGGWQVLDATPQEESPQGGGYRLGPCPLQAVKLGQRMNYDVEFVISEVNADVRTYTIYQDGTTTLDKVDSTQVGKNISTKAIGSSQRQDVTSGYKFREGSTSERAALLADVGAEKQIGVELSVDPNVWIGKDFFVRVTVTNKGSATKEFTVNLHGRAVLYTGAPGRIVKALRDQTIILSRNESKTLELWVQEVDYLRILEGGNLINFVAMAVDKGDKLSVVKTDTLRLKTPDITITLPEGGLKLYQPATINVSFTNPLSRRLSGGKFSLHGEGYLNDVSVEVSSVGPNRVASASVQTIPVKTGSFELVVRFSSNQLTDILGDEDVEVVAA